LRFTLGRLRLPEAATAALTMTAGVAQGPHSIMAISRHPIHHQAIDIPLNIQLRL
jgi:hypothetical protein